MLLAWLAVAEIELTGIDLPSVTPPEATVYRLRSQAEPASSSPGPVYRLRST